MKFTKKILKNGLRVISVPMPDNPSITVLVLVDTGSKYEQKENNGISHFLEHMVFKGTPRRPGASLISKELDSIGAQYNAFTSHEVTAYYAKAAKKHFDKILDVVSDMYLNPLFDQKEIDKEKGVIVEEIKMYNDLPQRQVQEVFFELLYGDQPAGWPVIGSEKNVRSFTKKDFEDYRKIHYIPKATTVVVAGDVDVKKIPALVEKAFKGMKDGSKGTKKKVTEKQGAPQLKIAFKETDQTHVVIGFRSFNIKDKRSATMSVMGGILGGGMSSRLFSKMRDELGICYYVNAMQDAYTDHGVFAISAGVDNTRVDVGIKEILAECKKMCSELVSEAEMKKVKDYIAGRTLLGLETSDARAEYCGSEEVMKKEVENPDDYVKKIQKVTAKDVQKLAKEIFVNKGLNMAIIGKFKDEKRFAELLKV